jgi:hypothetical protein
MGQTQPQKQTGSGQHWAPVGSVGGDLQPSGLRRLCSQGLRQSKSGSVWLSQGGLGSCQLQARPGVVGSGLGPFTGAWPYPAFPACPAGRGAHFPQPRKKGLGAVCRGHVRAMEVALGVVKDSPSGRRGSKLAAKGSVVTVPF